MLTCWSLLSVPASFIGRQLKVLYKYFKSIALFSKPVLQSDCFKVNFIKKNRLTYFFPYRKAFMGNSAKRFLQSCHNLTGSKFSLPCSQHLTFQNRVQEGKLVVKISTLLLQVTKNDDSDVGNVASLTCSIHSVLLASK